ncbi:hypothetical protein COO60DRAFT_1517978 [Scenedesmus sp. NREL 46B-D3]|nr:hypothetical protein COO60DRAFT_1517978 [Scenedesmus sp. NREL 46B-D3]
MTHLLMLFRSGWLLCLHAPVWRAVHCMHGAAVAYHSCVLQAADVWDSCRRLEPKQSSAGCTSHRMPQQIYRRNFVAMGKQLRALHACAVDAPGANLRFMQQEDVHHHFTHSIGTHVTLTLADLPTCAPPGFICTAHCCA